MEQDIIEGNKLIAEFMGGVFVISEREFIWHNSAGSITKSATINKLKYHTSWDWLMPVVEKIEGIRNSDEYEVDIFGKCCDIGGKIETVGITKIQAVWLAVIEFIKWHNSNK